MHHDIKFIRTAEPNGAPHAMLAVFVLFVGSPQVLHHRIIHLNSSYVPKLSFIITY